MITARSSSSSRHPHDWGRSVAITLESLVAQSQGAETDWETSELFGADLTLRIEPLANGATVTIVWDRPENQYPEPTQRDRRDDGLNATSPAPTNNSRFMTRVVSLRS